MKILLGSLEGARNKTRNKCYYSSLRKSTQTSQRARECNCGVTFFDAVQVGLRNKIWQINCVPNTRQPTDRTLVHATCRKRKVAESIYKGHSLHSFISSHSIPFHSASVHSLAAGCLFFFFFLLLCRYFCNNAKDNKIIQMNLHSKRLLSFTVSHIGIESWHPWPDAAILTYKILMPPKYLII